MNFSVKVKNQIIEERLSQRCCRLSCLAGYLRTAGTIEIQKGKIGFSTTSEHTINAFFSRIIYSLYGVEAQTVTEKEGGRSKMTLISDVSLQILKDAEILSVTPSGIDVQLNIKDTLVNRPCCRTAYLKGAFLGSGSITVPKLKSDKATGYHLEFVFSKYLTALDFSHLLSDNGYIAKLVERKDSFVVYFKNSEEICDILVLMGAKGASLDLMDIIVKKTVRNNTNRVINCEISNMTKQIDASLKCREEITKISDVIGLDSLPLPLKEVAIARLDYPDDTLSALSARLGITKSCLSHRLKKLSLISESL